MRSACEKAKTIAQSALKWLLSIENQLIGLVLLVLAIDSWIRLIERAKQLYVPVLQGFYAIPSLTILAIAFSSIYLTAVSAILLTASRPLARYETLIPNFLALLGGFGIYGFSLLPASDKPVISLYVPLLFLTIGAGIVVFCLIYLRRAFSVTPQARWLIDGGPYSIVRHPMYIGNIITLVGIALLFGTLKGILLFFACAALQICRAKFEERLLIANIPDYASYKTRVGGFWPKLKSRRSNRALIAMVFCFCILSPAPLFSNETVSKGASTRPL